MSMIKVGNRVVGDNNRPLMIAEEGQANQGNFEVAKKMCKLAAKSGADGIEFQLFTAKDMYLPNDEGFNIYKERELTDEQIKDLVDTAHSYSLIFQVAGLSPEIIKKCAVMDADVFVVNATDLTNPVIIDSVINTEKPFFLATLMGSVEEIDWAVKYVSDKGCSNFGLLHGQHVMSAGEGGVPVEFLQLDCIQDFKDRYGVVTGFVDHTNTEYTSALAVSKGADLITKHLFPDKKWRGPDWEICLDPEGWRNAREMVQYAFDAQGSSKEISQAELKDRSLHRRSIYTNKPLQSGHILSNKDIVMLRPGLGGLDPRELLNLPGKVINKDLKEFHQLQMSDFS
jgi:N,N'-diacetyllegionaminate synthase